MPFFFLTIENTPINRKKFHGIKYISNKKIYAEINKSKGFRQCYICQCFNHSSQGCLLPFRCLKCGEGYETRSFPKDKNSQSKCCNCDNSITQQS